MSVPSDFARCTRSNPCPMCERPDWCLTGLPGTEFEGDTICQRVESDRRFGDAGFLHRGGGKRSRPGPLRRFIARIAAPADPSFLEITTRARACTDPRSFRAFANQLCVAAWSLNRLDVGTVGANLAENFHIRWAKGSWTFPMRAADGEVTGIRLRMPDGSKCAVPGSHDGLFIPNDIGNPDQLLICEGATDTAAMLDLGFAAIGRPSCRGSRREVVRLVRRLKPRSVVIVADRDPAGLVGAHELALELVTRVAELRVISPPDGIKDAREWKRSGAAAAAVQEAIEATPARRVSICIRSREQ